MGSGSFAHQLFLSLIEIGFLPNKVVTTPPRRKGRGLKLVRSQVSSQAEKVGVPVNEVEDPNDEDFVRHIRSLEPDFIVVSDYGKILKPNILGVPKHYPLNVHPSLLPKYRGAAPIERALMDGVSETGVTVFVMDEGVDTGPILLQERIPIDPFETKGDIVPKLAKRGALLLRSAIGGYLRGEITPTPQPGEGASYAKKIKKSELWLDFSADARTVVNHVRALSPLPGARTMIDGMLVKVIRAEALEGDGEPGKILPGRELLIGCGEGVVKVMELVPEGKRPMSGEEFRRGRPNLSRAGGSKDS